MEREIKKIGIIGHFGGTENILDGQTIKTKILYEELSNVTDWDIVKVDTYYKKKNPIKLFIDTLVCMKKSQDIIVLLSRNGMKFYFPLLALYAKKFHTRIYHDVIGGNLDTYVKKYTKYRAYLNTFKVNWVETEGLKKKLEMEGINKCEVIPNFKRLKLAEIEQKDYRAPYHFCIFSRIMKEKGVEIAIEAIKFINEKYKRELCTLDIYGRIDDGYKEEFEKIMNHVSNSIRYMGMVPYNQSVETIKKYYALLFPTYWDGEGFPGTIIDAFSAGIPVIATNWNCNSEIIENKKNGILYPSEELTNIEESIEWLIEHKDSMNQMKKQCIESAKKYQPDEYIDRIVKEIIDK